MFDVLTDLWELCIGFFSFIFDSFFTDVWSLLETYADGFTEYLVGILGFTGLEALLSNVTLAGLVFSVGALVWVIVYFFIP